MSLARGTLFLRLFRTLNSQREDPASRIKSKFSECLAQRTISSTARQQCPTIENNATNNSTTPSTSNPGTENQVTVTFLKRDGKRSTVRAKEGKSLYDAVIDNNVDIDGFGACEGTLCCTTCHLIFKQSDYEKVGEPSDEELDMLDLAYGLTDTSRLGCQVTLKKNLDPLEVHVPASINDIRES